MVVEVGVCGCDSTAGDLCWLCLFVLVVVRVWDIFFLCCDAYL